MRKYVNMEHKYEYVTGHSRSPGCFLCLAAQGKLKELVLYVDDKVVIMLNKFPYNTGHLLIAPARHVKDYEELTDEEALALHWAIKESIRILKKVFHPDGFNVGINLGRAAGASQEHLHIHVVPRRFGEYNFMEVIVGAKSVLQKPEKVWEILKPEFDKLRGGRPHQRVRPIRRHHGRNFSENPKLILSVFERPRWMKGGYSSTVIRIVWDYSGALPMRRQ